MTEAVFTTSTAPSSPTPPAPAVAQQAEPTRHDNRPGVISDAAYDALAPADRDRFARVRQGPQGGSMWQERSTLPSETADGKPAAAADGTQSGTAPDPNAKYKVGSYEFTESEMADLLRFKGEHDLRRAAVPADPNGYTLPVDLPGMPPGTTWTWDEADPALAAARTWTHQQGLSQEQFAGLVAQYGAIEARKEAGFREAVKAQIEALGSNGTMRITALDTWLRGTIGEELAKVVRVGLVSAKQVEALEQLAKKFASQGAASFSQAHRVAPDVAGRVSEEAYAAMSPAQRWDYVRSFDQKQFRNGDSR
jgi:hypothetical protein